jgi:aminoglycoside 6'-N-acetyltransferase
MTAANRYSFRKVTLGDLPLLAAWRSNPHVRAWWDSDQSYDAAYLSDPRVARWIVSIAGRPFAFMQDYTVHGWEEHPFAELPRGSRGIDQYIGDPEMIGIGHGSAFIGARMRALFDAGAPVIAPILIRPMNGRSPSTRSWVSNRSDRLRRRGGA